MAILLGKHMTPPTLVFLRRREHLVILRIHVCRKLIRDSAAVVTCAEETCSGIRALKSIYVALEMNSTWMYVQLRRACIIHCNIKSDEARNSMETTKTTGREGATEG